MYNLRKTPTTLCSYMLYLCLLCTLRDPNVTDLFDNDDFRLKRRTVFFRAFRVVYITEYLKNVLLPYMAGVAHMVQLPMSITETDSFYIFSYTATDDCTPAILLRLVLPSLPDLKKGVVIVSNNIPWLDCHLTTEYAKLVPWVAIGDLEIANVVFTTNEETYHLGKCIFL